MPKLSIIILSYNTRETTKQCLQALVASFHTSPLTHFEIIVVDNASSDGSVEMIQEFAKKATSSTLSFVIIPNTENVGYPKGNNLGVSRSQGEFILYLNSDAIIQNVDWNELFTYLQNQPEIGALTVKVMLPAGSIDPASHRGFPTAWNALSYYSGLEKLTQHIPQVNKLFGGYHLKHQDLDSIHEIDSPSGAFFLTRKSVLEKVGGFDETFFMYGEDLDLAFRIKENGYKIVYYPAFTVLHLKYQSGLQTKTVETQKKTKGYFYNAMKIFYKKHYEAQNPVLLNKLIYFGIDLKSKLH